MEKHEERKGEKKKGETAVYLHSVLVKNGETIIVFTFWSYNKNGRNSCSIYTLFLLSEKEESTVVFASSSCCKNK